jgi:hypothetical protein
LSIAKRRNVFYIAAFGLKPCGNNIRPLKLSATFPIFDFDAADRPAMISDKTLIYSAFIDINTLFNRDFL